MTDDLSLASLPTSKGGCTFAADVDFELNLFGVPIDFRKVYLDHDPELRGSPCLNPGLCGNGRAHCRKCSAKLIRISQSWDVPSHVQIMVRHVRMWHASACHGQDNLIGHGLPIRPCGVDCPFKRYTSKKFDAEYLQTRDVQQPHHSNWASNYASGQQEPAQRWEKQDLAADDFSTWPPWRSAGQQVPRSSSSASTRSSSTRLNKRDGRVEGWF
ncbi:unnamed protein product [Polarella glacialis]|uniref:Uncharacterized protein n=1 Tax=Polarella glacialis TaxID=89957 RepID=A0A813KRR5_POLGL|nr:unnamed protein product [Polarella glacialis]